MAQTSKEGQWPSHSQWVHVAVCGNCEWSMECLITAIVKNLLWQPCSDITDMLQCLINCHFIIILSICCHRYCYDIHANCQVLNTNSTLNTWTHANLLCHPAHHTTTVRNDTVHQHASFFKAFWQQFTPVMFTVPTTNQHTRVVTLQSLLSSQN